MAGTMRSRWSTRSIGRFSRRSRPTGIHRHTNIRRGESRSVIDAVADHHDFAVFSFGKDHDDFLIGRQFRSHGVDPEAGRYGFRNLATVFRWRWRAYGRLTGTYLYGLQREKISNL
jgi:hypothetical protein